MHLTKYLLDGTPVPIELGQVMHGDMVDIVTNTVSDRNWAHMVCTEPSDFGSPNERREREGGWLDAWDRVLRPDGVLAIVDPWVFMSSIIPQLREKHWHIDQVLTVIPHNTTKNYASGAVLIATKTGHEVPDFDRHFQRLTNPPWSSGCHQEIVDRLVQIYSNPGDVVFDGHMGMGTTAIACEHLGRQWFGCEQDGKRIGEAYDRIERETDWRRGAVQS